MATFHIAALMLSEFASDLRWPVTLNLDTSSTAFLIGVVEENRVHQTKHYTVRKLSIQAPLLVYYKKKIDTKLVIWHKLYQWPLEELLRKPHMALKASFL